MNHTRPALSPLIAVSLILMGVLTQGVVASPKPVSQYSDSQDIKQPELRELKPGDVVERELSAGENHSGGRLSR